MARLTIIKAIHTTIWLFFNVVLSYMAYAVIVNKIDYRVWVGLSLIGLEGIILVLFRMSCPLTLIARKYSNSPKDNFDIYLPNWLARNNKLIYTIILGIIVCMLIYRLISNT